MRIIHTVQRYAPSIGGAERVVERISTGLVDRGHEVMVITSGSRTWEIRDGVRIERFPVEGNLALGLRGDPTPALDLIQALEPDVVMNYAAQTWTTDACLRFLEEPQAFAHVLAPCGFSGLHDLQYDAYFRGMREWLPRYDALIFHSSNYQDWHFAADAGATRRHVIPNAADPPAQTRLLRKRMGERSVVLTVGSHVRSKGHDDFVRLIDKLGVEEAVGVIVAPPRYGSEIVRGCYLGCLVASARRRRLFVIDGRDPATVADAIASADVFVLPSQVECAPLVILEAMAAGVPWVSYDVGNVRELEGGIVVGTFEDLFNQTRSLLWTDEQALGVAGLAAWSRRHRWADVVELYERLYGSLIGASVLPDHALP